MVSKALFSSHSDDWATPQALFDALNAVFKFETDVCAVPENAKCERFFTPAQNGLLQVWSGTCWMNPPYGRTINQWIKKAFESTQTHQATVVCLLPARVDTKWWHHYCIHGEVTFLKGRVKFGGAKNSAPFPSVLVVFRPQVAQALMQSHLHSGWTKRHHSTRNH
ncbi:DNA N-6-adenine-methyltransferase [Formosimonas limnophila]|uniref:DNA N-6-adenine-methyltransferase n=1 Tax=Formosimonas limnophila TaxID=1384487 RepID=UPI0016726603|nr:DNA N-6-adenine-methyltransferase [Formosimonas limnophila]